LIPSFVRDREEKGLPFDLYFAGTQNKMCEQWMMDNNACRLQSQLNDRTNINHWIETTEGELLFIDSGAFTAHTKGTEVDVDNYLEYVNKIDDHVRCFVQVDKIPGRFGQPKTREEILEAPKLSWDNYLYMRPKCKSPDKLMPVFHHGEDFKWLENMLEYTDENNNHIDYICLSPANDKPVKEKVKFLEKCYAIIEASSNPNVKTHLLGFTSLKWLEQFPCYSADSTAWIQTGAVGNVMTPFGTLDISENSLKDIHSIRNTPVLKDKFESYIHSIGLNPEELYNDYKSRLMANLIYLYNWAKDYKYKGPNHRVIRKGLF